MLNKKISFFLIIFLALFFSGIKQSANAAYPCDYDVNGPTMYKTVQTVSYTCVHSTNPVLPVHGCDKSTNSVNKECGHYGNNNVCGFTVIGDQTCTDYLYHGTGICHGSPPVCDVDEYRCTIKNVQYPSVYDNVYKTYVGGGSSRFISCGKPPSCNPKTINCNGKCGAWDRGCPGISDKDCGSCSSNETCQVSSDSKTNTGGYCKPKPTGACNPKSCTDIGADGSIGAPCGKQTEGRCSSQITCGGCDTGLACTGANGAGVGGHCTPKNNPTPPDPSNPPPQAQTTILTFYDTYASNADKGTERAYTSCYPAIDGKGNKGTHTDPSNVAFKIDSKDGGSNPYNYPSHVNCKNGGALGYTVNRTDNNRKVILTVPANYRIVGYNYTVDGGATVRCIGASQPGCSNFSASDRTISTPYLDGRRVTVRFGVETGGTPPPAKLKGFVFVDDNGNDQYDPGDFGNNESCFNSANNGDVKIKYDGGNPDDFTQDKQCNNFFKYPNPSSNSIALNSIPGGYKATGFEYQDATGSCRTDSATGNPDPDINGWCIRDLDSAVTSESVFLAGESEVHFGVKPTVQNSHVTGFVFDDNQAPFGTMNGSDDAYFNDCPPNNSTCPAKYRTISAYAFSERGVLDTTPTDSSASGPSGYDLSLPPGKYRIEYYDFSTSTAGPPPTYTPTYPTSATRPLYVDVTVGSSDCWIERSGQTSTVHGATCSGGNINNLNFGISSASNQPWFQGVGGDVRVDGDLYDLVPPGNNFVSIALSSPAADSGILFTAQPSAHLRASDPQSNAASPNHWLSVSNPFNPTGAGTRTSWTYLSATIAHGGVDTSIGLVGHGYCGNGTLTSCTLQGSQSTGPNTTFPSGVYKTNSDLTIINGNYTFPTNSNYIFLVNGNLNIQGNIIVPTTSTVVFAAHGDITVDRPVTRIDGIYSAEGKFDPAGGNGNVNVNLTVNGEIVANAKIDKTSYTIDQVFLYNSRDLGAGNSRPSITVNIRPDFLIHLPGTLKVPNYSIEEVAPGTVVANSPTTAPTSPPTTAPTPTPTSAKAIAFRESGGQVVMEAEHYDVKTAGDTGHNWSVLSTSAGYQGTGYVQSLPDTTTTQAPPSSAELGYKVYFATAGTYKVWFRAQANDTDSQVSTPGLNETPAAVSISNAATGNWNWSNVNGTGNSATINIPSAGLYTINLFEKGDGEKVDVIVLNTSGTQPSNPTESPRNNSY